MRRTPPIVDRPERLGTMLEDLAAAPVIAVDAEMDSFYSYHEKICLMQFSTESADYLLDPMAGLELTRLGPVLADPEKVKVFHAGENDVPYLRGHFGLELRNLFDTYLAARVLGYPRCGLAGLLEAHFKVDLDKRYQMADWRVRPIPEEQAEYARTDTRYLIPLRGILMRELEEAGRLEEATAEFRRAERVEYVPREFDPDGWFKLKGVRDLSPRGRAVLRELYLWRDETARNHGVPPFRIISDRLLVGLAEKPPTNRAEMEVHARNRAVSRYRRELMDRVARGMDAAPLSAPRQRRTPRSPEMTPEERNRYKKLRDWRNKRCGERGVEPDRVATNRLLEAIARAQPATAQELGLLPGMERWRLAEYGEEIVEVLREP